MHTDGYVVFLCVSCQKHFAHLQLAKLGCKVYLMCSPVCDDWAKSETLISRAGSGRLVLAPNDKLGREDLVTNEEVVSAILKHLGVRTTIDQINEHVELFFSFSRPKGKPAFSRSMSSYGN